jgi:hypothetical protein
VVTREDDPDDVEAGEDPGPFVRPYTITGVTGGLIRSWHTHLPLETLVITSSSGAAAATQHLGFERRWIVLLCRDIQSIAEISARLELPLGVARALVGDLAEEGLVEMHGPAHEGEQPGLALLRRVLDGLHRI